MPRSPDAALTAHLERIKELANDLARVNGGDTPVTNALADAIKREVEALQRALTRPTRYPAGPRPRPSSASRGNEQKGDPLTKDSILKQAANWDRQESGARWKVWQECHTPHTRAELQATTDDPPFVYCGRCQCVWKPPVDQLFPEAMQSPGKLLNEPLKV
jgi:hypothetical protein